MQMQGPPLQFYGDRGLALEFYGLFRGNFMVCLGPTIPPKQTIKL
jgi:hypothetical protein